AVHGPQREPDQPAHGRQRNAPDLESGRVAVVDRVGAAALVAGEWHVIDVRCGLPRRGRGVGWPRRLDERWLPGRSATCENDRERAADPEHDRFGATLMPA